MLARALIALLLATACGYTPTTPTRPAVLARSAPVRMAGWQDPYEAARKAAAGKPKTELKADKSNFDEYMEGTVSSQMSAQTPWLIGTAVAFAYLGYLATQ